MEMQIGRRSGPASSLQPDMMNSLAHATGHLRSICGVGNGDEKGSKRDTKDMVCLAVWGICVVRCYIVVSCHSLLTPYVGTYV